MTKREINVFDHANEITSALRSGILLTTKAGDKTNTMTIGWGMLGIEWGKPIFITYVREGRYTTGLLKENGEFTVNIPVGDYDRNIIAFCGTKSGRSVDKFAELGLTAVPSDTIAPPAIRELPLTLECRVLYSRTQANNTLPETMFERHYPQSVPSDDPMSNRDFHIEFYGEILKAYILEED